MNKFWKCVVGIVAGAVIVISLFTWCYTANSENFYVNSKHVTELTEAEQLGWLDFLYFSVVTWCGLGYGDIAPATTGIRLMAALETFLGIISFGILIAAAARMRK